MNDVFIGFISALGKKNPIKNRFNGIKKFRKYNKKSSAVVDIKHKKSVTY